MCQSESISESTCNIEVEQENKSTCTSENKQPVNMSVPMIVNTEGTLIERGQCFQYQTMNFAATDITCEHDKESVIRGLMIFDGKLDESIKIEMPASKSVQCISPSLDKSGKEFLNSLSLLHSKQAQLELRESDSLVRQSVRQAVIASQIRKEVASALSSRSHTRRFCLGVCSFEYDIEMFELDIKSKKREFSYKKGNISRLDDLLGSLWDIKCIDGNQFRFVTQLVVKLKGFQLTVSVSTAISRFEFDEKEYRNVIMSMELVPDENLISDNEEANDMELQV